MGDELEDFEGAVGVEDLEGAEEEEGVGFGFWKVRGS